MFFAIGVALALAIYALACWCWCLAAAVLAKPREFSRPRAEAIFAQQKARRRYYRQRDRDIPPPCRGLSAFDQLLAVAE